MGRTRIPARVPERKFRDRRGPTQNHLPIGVGLSRLSGSAPFPPIFNEPEPLFVRVEEKVPKGAIPENAPRLPEGKEWDQRNKENGRVTQKAGQRAAQVGEGLRQWLASEPGPNRFLDKMKREQQDREGQRLAEHDPNQCTPLQALSDLERLAD